jgi:4-amino-4-deoxy-L-arabinose transferase-like glycosyltransferase
VGSVGGGPVGTTGRWGATGWSRLFGADMGGQISWLVPAALVFLVALLWLSRHGPRTDGRRAAVVLWGGWLVVTGLVFSFAKGIIHAYYTVALAPAVAALVGIGAVSLWRRRGRPMMRVTLAAALAATGGWSSVLLGRSPDWFPWLLPTVLAVALLAAALIAVGRWSDGRLGANLAVAALAASLAGPVAYSLSTAAALHTGAIPSAGPRVAGGLGGRPGGFPDGPGQGGPAQRAPGQFPGGADGAAGAARPGPGPGRGGRGGGPGGLLDARTPGAALVRLLQQNGSRYTWVAATVGANSAAGVQLATGQPMMAIGGFNGTDPSPTLDQFQDLVAAGKIHYFLAGGRRGPGGGESGTSSSIASWVERTFSAATVGGTTVYDLTNPLVE